MGIIVSVDIWQPHAASLCEPQVSFLFRDPGLPVVENPSGVDKDPRNNFQDDVGEQKMSMSKKRNPINSGFTSSRYDAL